MLSKLHRILRLPQVVEATGETRSTIYKRISEGEFPRPVKLGAKSVGWVEAEIAGYNEARIAARDAGAAQCLPSKTKPLNASLVLSRIITLRRSSISPS